MNLRQFDSNRGFSLMEVMVVAGVGTILALGITSLIVTSVQASRTARAALEYANLVTVTKKNLDARTTCNDVLGAVTYEGEEIDVPELNIYNTTLEVGDVVPGSGLMLEQLYFQDPVGAATPVDLIIDGVNENLMKYETQLVIAARRTTEIGIGGNQMRPIPLPVTLYVNPVTDVVRFCAGNDESMACSQIGGNYIPAQDDGTPPSCDIRPAVGGCLLGGTYSLVNNACATGNPYTGGCTCRNGFGATRVVDYRPYKNATLQQWQCLNCADGLNANFALDPLYNNDQLQEDLLCMQDPQANCPCEADPDSPQCTCQQNPNNPNCSDPCFTEPGGCPCFMSNNPLPPGQNYFVFYSAEPVCQQYFQELFGNFGGFMGGFGGGFMGGLNP